MANSIAIDGPAGAGKSTIAKEIAKQLQFIYVDTGAMYRAMAIYFIKHEVDCNDEDAINDACDNIKISIAYENQEQQVILNGENITGQLRNEEVGKMASRTSVYAKVRKKLVDLQRELASTSDVVMDGRDIGTTVLPNAKVKIYLTASVEARAQRRFLELNEKGESAEFEKIKIDIEQRDYQDINRENSPLRQAEDAILVDSSNIGIHETIETIVQIINDKMK